MDVARPPAAPRSAGGPASPAGQAAGAALVALARAARSFVLYDAGNATIRQFLADYAETTRAALDRYGPLSAVVRPFEMVMAGEVVYQDRDRERSLAFKLFRDGVRRLAIQPGVPWEELLRLLEILAVRYTCVRQQEDDIVTMLRKAEFSSISFEAVLGFAPAEESPEPDVEGTLQQRRLVQPPAGWDTPLNKLPKPGPLDYQPVPDDDLAPLRAEEEDVGELALSVARDLLAEAVRAAWPSPNADLVAFMAELRDALLVDGRLESLKRLVDLVGEVGGAEVRDGTLRGLGDARTLELVLAQVPPAATELPDELVPFLPLLAIEPTLDRLAAEASAPRQRLLVGIVVARLPREAQAVLARLPRLPERLARDLARALAARMPERSVEVARFLLAQKDEALRLEGLAVLERAPGEVPLRPLVELLRDRSGAVRIRAAEVIGRRGHASDAEALRAALEMREVPPEEAEALGRAMAALAPAAAMRLFARWLEPPSRFLRRPSPHERALQWAAVAGTGALPGDEAEAVLSALADGSDGELRRRCLAALARRRNAGAA
jgi:hypothetical protein